MPLARQLVDAEHRVAILHRGSAPQSFPAEVLQVQGDRNELAACRRAIEEFSPDAVVDLILSSGEQARQLMDEASQWTGRVVAISSMDVYRAWGILHGSEPGDMESLPLTEESPVRTVRQLYPAETLSMLRGTFSWLNDSYDKIAVEKAVMGHALAAGTVVRLPMVYGPGDRLHRFFPLLKRIADGRRAIPMADDLAAWRGPRGYVENVAHAIALAATNDRAAGRIYNVCEEPCLAELEWQKRIAAGAGWEGRFVILPWERMPKHLLQPGNAAQHIVTSSERIRAELAFSELVDLEESIRRTIAWEQENPPASTMAKAFDYEAEDRALQQEG